VATEIRPCTLRQAREFVNVHHRHHRAPQGGQFALALLDGRELVGVAIGGRPVARGNDDGLTLEVTRVCVLEGVPNGCSKLYLDGSQAASRTAVAGAAAIRPGSG
jgi:hypothetical protein